MSNGDSVKKIINNGAFIANLAPLLPGPEAAALATAARTHANILRDLGITVPTDDFGGCEQAQLLIGWITKKLDGADSAGAAEQMAQWTADIWHAISELASGDLPKH